MPVAEVSVQPWLWVVLLAGVTVVFALEAVDRIGAPTRRTGGTIMDARDVLIAKTRHRCVVDVSTPEGDFQTRYVGDCRGRWRRGEAVTFDLVDRRLTGKAVLGGSLEHSTTPAR